MKRIIQFPVILCVALAIIVSCDKKNDEVPAPEKGDILVTTMLPNPDGESGSAYMQLIDNLEPVHLTNRSATPLPYWSSPSVIGNDVYTMSGYGMETDVLTRYTRIDGKLVKQGECILPAQSGAVSLVVKDKLAYVSCVFTGKIHILNYETMTQVSEIDLSTYGEDQNPDPTMLLIRDNLLYVPVNQMVGGYYPAPERPFADVIIINTDNNQVVKMISEKTSGISQVVRPSDPNSIFMDEKKDIYLVGVGAFGALPGHNAGILRIKAGETEFDQNYKFVLNTTPIEGESNPLNYIQAVKYAGNGKLYASVNIPAYYSNPPNFIEDRNVASVVIDLEAKTIKKLDLPYSSTYGGVPALYKDKVVFALSTKTANGFYTYHPATGEASSTPVITTDGYPYSFIPFE